MSDTTAAMPVAVPPDGTDPTTYYAGFTNNFDASLIPGDGLRFWTTDDATLRKVHGILRGAMRYVDTGEVLVGDELATAPSLLVKTWPTDFLVLRDGLLSPPIATITYEGVDASDVQSALEERIAEILGTVDPTELADMVSAFMSGSGSLVLAGTGSCIGGTALATDGPDPALTRGTTVRFWDANDLQIEAGTALEQLQELVETDLTGHPLTSAVTFGGTLTIRCLDSDDNPLVGESYTLYLADGSTSAGTTDSDGMIQVEGVAQGWGLDLPGHPAFYLESGV